MRINIVLTRKFKKIYTVLPESRKLNVDRAIVDLERYFETGVAPAGLGLTKLYPQIYEARAGIALRIVYILEEPNVFLVLIGSHDDVRRFLKKV